MLDNLNKCLLLLFKNNAVFHSSIRERFGIGELIIFVLMVEIPVVLVAYFRQKFTSQLFLIKTNNI